MSDSRYGVANSGNIEIKYWSEYVNDGKTMYFKVRVNGKQVENLKAIKGLRRNNKYGYYTKRVVVPKDVLKVLLEEYIN